MDRFVFRCAVASLYEVVSVRQSVGPSVRWSVRRSVRMSRALLLRGIYYGLMPAGGTVHRYDFGGLLIPNPMLGFRTSAQISQRLGDSNLRRSGSVDSEPHALTI